MWSSGKQWREVEKQYKVSRLIKRMKRECYILARKTARYSFHEMNDPNHTACPEAQT